MGFLCYFVIVVGTATAADVVIVGLRAALCLDDELKLNRNELNRTHNIQSRHIRWVVALCQTKPRQNRPGRARIDPKPMLLSTTRAMSYRGKSV